ncbi:hypothetical protein H0H81_001899 [Sphagnurus paluster]|uniref:G domain-containing protein n=1 Tax=Sphagnurus paluster TaxID=117069 RepID=A0A9P7GU61_9AGAR|nr:hypothetical protein H0H81_001899 [Sphagnurus paluster]
MHMMFGKSHNKKAKNAKKYGWQADVKPGHFMEDPKDSDIIIPQFINTLLGGNVAPVGHSLTSHTNDVQHMTFPHPQDTGRRVVIIDTPGFDHTSVDDEEILRRIAIWLAQSYHSRMKLAGIVYLHEITQCAMTSAQKNLHLFSKLCGPQAIKNVVLATTKWSDIDQETGVKREEILKEGYWKAMLELGSTVHRFDATQTSARSIITRILEQDPVDSILIQQELVDLEKALADTAAARSIRDQLYRALEVRNETAAQIQDDADSSELHFKAIENENRIRALFGQIRDLNSNVSRRVMRWFGL